MRYEFEGEVIRGKGLGRKLGFPTANLSIAHVGALPYGVYAARVCVFQRWYRGIVNVGRHPTLPEGPPTVEVHIIGCFDDFYGERIAVQLTGYIRDEKTFLSVDALREQIQEDLQTLVTDGERADE